LSRSSRARLTALAAELPALLDRPVRPWLLGSAVLVVGTARCLGFLPVQRFPELAFGVVFRCIGHAPQRSALGTHPSFPFPLARLHGGMSYTCSMGRVINTRRSSTIARR